MLSRIKKILPDEKRKSLSKTFHRMKNFGFDYFPGDNVESLRDKINLYFKLFPSGKKDFLREIEFINTQSRSDTKFSYILPYEFVFDYVSSNVQVLKDEDSGLYYVMHNGKKLFYSSDHTDPAKVAFTYNCICIEQDLRSPHRYLTDSFKVNEGDTVLDIGAAEGNFALDVIEEAGRVILFETDEKWIEALKLTFEPWRDKVEIVNKFVSNVDNEKCITLKKLFSETKIDFIKMDVEGAEVEILESSEDILKDANDLKLAVCTYHTSSDKESVEKILNKCGYDCEATPGFMLFIYSHLTPPYFRKVLLRATKRKS